MESRRPRILVAAQPAAWPVLRQHLEGLADLVPVHTLSDALHVLGQDAAGIDLVVCTLTFSDHRMLEFLLEVKNDPGTGAIPFLVCRVIVGRLSEEMVERMGAVARQFDADFINLARFPPGEARAGLAAAVVKCLGPGKAGGSRRP